MIALIVSFVSAVLALLIPNRSPYSRLWRPSFLVSALSVFGLLITWLNFNFEGLDPLVLYLYSAGVAAFLAGDYLVSVIVWKGTRPPRPQLDLDLVRAPPLIPLYSVLALLGMILIAYVYDERSTMFNMFGLGAALRYAQTVRLQTYGAFHFLLFAAAIGSVLVVNRRWNIRVIGYACFLALAFASFVSVARSILFFNMAALAFLMYVRTGRMRSITWPVAALAVGTFYYAAFANKEEWSSGESFFVYYAGYGLYAFNRFILPMQQWDMGLNSLGTIGSLLQGGLVPEDLSLEGTEYNVYTFIGSPYRDFGTLGVVGFPFLFAMLWSFIWNRTGDRPIYLFMYGWMIYPCILPFFDWYFSLTTYLYMIPVYAILLKSRFNSEPEARPSYQALQPAA